MATKIVCDGCGQLIANPQIGGSYPTFEVEHLNNPVGQGRIRSRVIFEIVRKSLTSTLPNVCGHPDLCADCARRLIAASITPPAGLAQ